MSYTSYFRANAQEDLDSAHDWYRRERPELADQFCDELEATIERIERNPLGFARVTDEFRYITVNRFPYILIYFVRGERIEIEAVWHTHRDPEGWWKRLRGDGDSQ